MDRYIWPLIVITVTVHGQNTLVLAFQHRSGTNDYLCHYYLVRPWSYCASRWRGMRTNETLSLPKVRL